MTLEELEKVYYAAYEPASQANKYVHDDEAGTRAGIRAVVAALRDEMTLGWEDDRPWGDVADVNKFLNKILASDGVQGTHGSPELDEDARKLEAMGQDAGPTVQDLFPEVFAPAAAPV